MDYEEDYELINNIYSNVSFKNVLNLYDVIDYMDNNLEIAKLNQDCVQLELEEKVKEEIDRRYKENLEGIRRIKNDIYSK